MTTVKLSRTERWILANQYRILEALLPDEAEDFAQTRKALEQGFELDYSPHHIYDEDDVMTVEECQEVLDILNMHRALHDSYEALSDKVGIEKRDIEFSGFDGNNETKYMSYARYFCGLDGGQERFTELKRGDNFNSHMPIVGVYRRMLGVWKGELDSKFELSKQEIERIVAARAYRK